MRMDTEEPEKWTCRAWRSGVRDAGGGDCRVARLSERIHRERDAHVARQVELTVRSIELGAVVAPTVEKRRGRWDVRMAVPLRSGP